ncbi:MAG: cellobiose phosphorylase [Brachybacterium faecium]|nr:MAG: cellobiose phosphorylase [Brachybacterium faecium]
MTTTQPTSAERARTMPITVELTSAGEPRRLEADVLSMVQHPAAELESGAAGLWLRSAAGATRLTGPSSGGSIAGDGTVTTRSGPVLAAVRVGTSHSGTAWAWSFTLTNDGNEPVEVALTHAWDAALTPLPDLRRNEQYVAQYLDVTPVELGGSTAIAVRQNMPGDRHPWAVMGTTCPTAGWASDALQLLDEAAGEGLDPNRELPSRRLQHEHTLAVLRTAPQRLEPGQTWQGRFWGFALEDHPGATGEGDRELIESVLSGLSWPEAPVPAPTVTSAPDPTVASAQAPPDADRGRLLAATLLSAPVLPVREATDAEAASFAGGPMRLVERDGEAFLSGFSALGHVVSARKERQVLRPHGHLQHVAESGEADGTSTASTAWMSGVFASQLTHGHACATPALTVRRSYVGLQRGAGVRLWTRTNGGHEWQLLAVPSLWRADDVDAHWQYLTDDGTIDVHARPQLGGTLHLQAEVEGAARDLLLAVFPEQDVPQVRVLADGTEVPLDDDAALSSDGRGRGTATITALATRVHQLEVTLTVNARGEQRSEGEVVPGPAAHQWRRPRLTAPGDGASDVQASGQSAAAGLGEEVAVVDEMLRWLAHDAAVHYQAPRGLEQYTGGAWGTRDVCQGPVGLLLAGDEHAALRATILRILGSQQDDGSWPQWFEFLPDHIGPGHRDAHGDVVYWPLLAVGEYLAVTEDVSVLTEPLPWVGQESVGDPTPLMDHLHRALAYIEGHRTEDPRLPAYGHGDWNDSLQPAQPELARAMCSTWTTELEIHALRALAGSLRELGVLDPDGIVGRAEALADGAEQALRERLLVDGELAGYAILRNGGIEHLVHPRDETTGLQHGLLQMIHGISGGLLTAEEARHHAGLIEKHLTGPTGAYLFDRPVSYHGGVTTVFQRAETATFWGREIGLMYTHAHLRWLEALAHLGRGEQLWEEMLKVIPIGLAERVSGATRRQVNAYASSSDAGFPDRYTASERAAELYEGSTVFEAGWRVYSSGPGLLLRLVTEDVLGVRRRGRRVEIDPVLPPSMDGLRASIPFAGGTVQVTFRVGRTGCGVRQVLVDGQEVTGEPLEAAYREAGVALDAALIRSGSTIEVVVG